MTDTIRDALERLIELDDANSVLGVDPDITVWVDAIAAARAALAEQQGKLSPKELDHQPALSADDIPPGPFSEHELREQWNQQADEFNQWDSLDSCEQLAWAQARAIRPRRHCWSEPCLETARLLGVFCMKLASLMRTATGCRNISRCRRGRWSDG